MAPRKAQRNRNRRRSDVEPHELIDITQPEDLENGDDDLEPKTEEDTDAVSPEQQEVWDAVREEQYEVIEQLPLTLHRMFTLLRELDERYTAQVAELQSSMRRYIALRQTIAKIESPQDSRKENEFNGEHLKMDVDANPQSQVDSATAAIEAALSAPKPGETKKLLQRIAWLNAESVRTSEEKLALATTAYDLVDRHVRALDLGIKAEEAAFTLGLRPGTQPAASVQQNGTSGGLGMKTADEPTSSGARPRSRNRPRKPRPSVSVAPIEALDPLQPPPQSPSVDANGMTLGNLPSIAIDPNEPKYCYCNQVSYGEMIACDNDECEREWFHYSCAGLTEAPKQRWFCDDCKIALGIQPRERKKKHS